MTPDFWGKKSQKRKHTGKKTASSKNGADQPPWLHVEEWK